MAAINQRDKYVGMEKINNQGYKMVVEDYYDYDHIIVRFAEPYPCKVQSKICHFIRGNIKNHYAPTVCGVGITGQKYKTTYENGQHTREYTTWMNMLKRCYDEKHRYKNPTYFDVKCDPEWLYYENFYEWFVSQDNYEILKDANYCLDKDILIKGNRMYAPDKCTLVPNKVNNLLLKSNAIRGDCPVGTHKYHKRFVASCGGKENHVYIGIYPTVEEAFAAYKNYKENEIKKVAQEEFDKGTITKKCYDALMNYQIEITD